MPSLTTYKLLKQEHDARRGEFKTVHGTVQTPAFQNVATAGAIKGGLSAQDLKDIGAQVMLCNTYHLHLRPGDKLVADMGGLHKFTRWNGPILTDSGGFQVFSLETEGGFSWGKEYITVRAMRYTFPGLHAALTKLTGSEIVSTEIAVSRTQVLAVECADGTRYYSDSQQVERFIAGENPDGTVRYGYGTEEQYGHDFKKG